MKSIEEAVEEIIEEMIWDQLMYGDGQGGVQKPSDVESKWPQPPQDAAHAVDS